jgi:Ca2+-binding RTX toxin-like protein
VLTGTAGLEGIGNASANTLIGTAGDDFIAGKSGNDKLLGGAGNDTYFLGRGDGADTVQENDSTIGNRDTALFDAGTSRDQLWFRKVGNNLEVSIIGTGDKFTISNWYLGAQYHVEQLKAGDGKLLLDTQVQSLVQAMASFAPPAMGQTALTAAQQTALAPVLAASWH